RWGGVGGGELVGPLEGGEPLLVASVWRREASQLGVGCEFEPVGVDLHEPASAQGSQRRDSMSMSRRSPHARQVSMIRCAARPKATPRALSALSTLLGAPGALLDARDARLGAARCAVAVPLRRT